MYLPGSWLPALAHLIEISIPLELTTQGSDAFLLSQLNQEAQSFLNDLFLGFDSSELSGTIDQVFIKNNVRSHSNLLLSVYIIA
jgi:hypothetical protein